MVIILNIPIKILNQPIHQLMFDRVNNWVNELNLTDDDDNFDYNNINCNYTQMNHFQSCT